MTTHQEALEAARAAYQSAIPDGCWHANGDETDTPIRAAIRAYLSTLAPADNGLVERLRNPLSMSMFIRPADMISALLAERSESADALTASQAARTALAAENAALVHDNERYVKQAAELATKNERLRDLLKLQVHKRREDNARAASLQTLLDKAVEADPLDEMAKHLGWELSWGAMADDCTTACWHVHNVAGGRNDREWTLIGIGDTPRLALAATITAIKEATHADR